MASKKLFIDSSAMYAFIDRSDPNHDQAVRIIEQLSIQGFYLYTSLQVIQEGYFAVNRQLGITLGMEFLQAMSESNIEVLYPQRADFLAAVRVIRFNRDRQISLKEALIATLMDKKGIREIFTFTYWPNLLGTTSFLTR